MTGMELFDTAMEMLGYSNAEEISGKSHLIKKALTLINRVYAELHYTFVAKPKTEDTFKPLSNIREELQLPHYVLQDVAPYGLAMYLAQSESDADNQSLYAAIYNQKKIRGKAFVTITDRLPHVWG